MNPFRQNNNDPNQQMPFSQQGYQDQPQYGQQAGYQNLQAGYEQGYGQTAAPLMPPRAGVGTKSARVDQIEAELGQHWTYSSDVKMMMGGAKELWLLNDRGYEPIGVVQAVAEMSMGVKGEFVTLARGLAQGEMVELTRLQEDARQLALMRLQSKAKQMGADMVIDVIVTPQHRDEHTEVIAWGTAIKKTGDAAPKSQTGATILINA